MTRRIQPKQQPRDPYSIDIAGYGLTPDELRQWFAQERVDRVEWYPASSTFYLYRGDEKLGAVIDDSVRQANSRWCVIDDLVRLWDSERVFNGLVFTRVVHRRPYEPDGSDTRYAIESDYCLPQGGDWLQVHLDGGLLRNGSAPFDLGNKVPNYTVLSADNGVVIIKCDNGFIMAMDKAQTVAGLAHSYRTIGTDVINPTVRVEQGHATWLKPYELREWFRLYVIAQQGGPAAIAKDAQDAFHRGLMKITDAMLDEQYGIEHQLVETQGRLDFALDGYNSRED